MSLWNINFQGITENLAGVDDYVVFSAEPPWSQVESLFPNKPKQVSLVTDLEQETLDGHVSRMADCEYVVGLGGGVAIDTAKYVALKTGRKFISIPSVVSVNAYLTPRAAVRNKGVVSYMGDKFPDLVVIDLPVIQGAPRRLNVAGVGDIYSTTVALMDWKIAASQKGDPYDDETVAEGTKILGRLRNASADIKSVSKEGVRSLINLHAAITELQRPYTVERVKAKQEAAGKRVIFHGLWPEEGCEHVYFYALEKVTGRAFIHGEAVGTGAVIGTYMHGLDPEDAISDLDAYGLSFRPKEYSVTPEVFRKAIKAMQSVALEMDLDYLVFNNRKIDDDDIAKLWELLA